VGWLNPDLEGSKDDDDDDMAWLKLDVFLHGFSHFF